VATQPRKSADAQARTVRQVQISKGLGPSADAIHVSGPMKPPIDEMATEPGDPNHIFRPG
jgi:hypothetical protein